MRTLLLLTALCVTVTSAAAEPSGPAISVMGDGTLAIQDAGKSIEDYLKGLRPR